MTRIIYTDLNGPWHGELLVARRHPGVVVGEEIRVLEEDDPDGIARYGTVEQVDTVRELMYVRLEKWDDDDG